MIHLMRIQLFIILQIYSSLSFRSLSLTALCGHTLSTHSGKPTGVNHEDRLIQSRCLPWAVCCSSSQMVYRKRRDIDRHVEITYTIQSHPLQIYNILALIFQNDQTSSIGGRLRCIPRSITREPTHSTHNPTLR